MTDLYRRASDAPILTWPTIADMTFGGCACARCSAVYARRQPTRPPPRWASLGPVLLAAADRAGDYLASDEYRAMVTAVDSDHRQIQRDGEDLLRRIEVCS